MLAWVLGWPRSYLLDVRRLIAVFLAFRTSSDVVAAPGWGEAGRAFRRLRRVGTLIAVGVLLLLWLIVTIKSQAGRPFPDDLWTFFPRGLVYLLDLVFTPVAFGIILSALLQLVPRRSVPHRMSLAQALQVGFDVTAAIAAVMLVLLFTPYFAVSGLTLWTGQGSTTDGLLTVIPAYSFVVVALLWLVYWLAASRMTARTAGARFSWVLGLVLVSGVVAFALAAVLDPYVLAMLQPWWSCSIVGAGTGRCPGAG